MIKKVAESMALRKAFNANGVYAPEEMEFEIAKEKGNGNGDPKAIEGGETKATAAQVQTVISLDKTKTEEVLKTFTKQEAADLIRELSQQKPAKKKEEAIIE